MGLRETTSAWVRRLARGGTLPRVAVCTAVALAGLLVLAAVATVVRLLMLATVVAVTAGCAWLALTVWRGDPADPRAPTALSRRAVRRLRDLLSARAGAGGRPLADAAAGGPRAELDALESLERVIDEQRAAVAALRGSVEALGRDVVSRQERLAADSERLARHLAGEVEAMRRLLAQIERGLPAPTVRRPSEPVRADDTGIDSETGGTDLDRVYREVEAELRLEAVEERERALAELEERLRRRERNLAAFVGEAQSRLS